MAIATIAPHSAAWDRDAHFEPSLVPAMGALDFLGMMIPEQYDGLGLDTLTYLLALEEIAELLSIAPRTVRRDWDRARLLLLAALES